ncbi:hypothetical protein BKA81DRAFT_21018 [Phyllosticta paracitricarpa]|uniref:Uncharacterized protein n=2 Tax=Phyllosticta TaxID=121621 RepID=A0ABR1MDH0_9PEZI
MQLAIPGKMMDARAWGEVVRREIGTKGEELWFSSVPRSLPLCDHLTQITAAVPSHDWLSLVPWSRHCYCVEPAFHHHHHLAASRCRATHHRCTHQPHVPEEYSQSHTTYSLDKSRDIYRHAGNHRQLGNRRFSNIQQTLRGARISATKRSSPPTSQCFLSKAVAKGSRQSLPCHLLWIAGRRAVPPLILRCSGNSVPAALACPDLCPPRSLNPP